MAIPLHARTIYVSHTGSHTTPYTNWSIASTSILEAVNIATNEDVVLITNGLYYPASSVILDKGITVNSMNGRDITILDGLDSHPLFSIEHEQAIVMNLTIQNGQGINGGGININNGTIAQCTIVSNRATGPGWYDGDGGGVYMSGGLMTNCLLQHNDARVYGGGIFCYLNGTSSHCTIITNTARGDYGGGIYLDRGGYAKHSIIASNYADSGGGIYCNNGGSASNCMLQGNNAIFGGGAFISLNGIIQDCCICENYAEGTLGGNEGGAGVYLSGGGLLTSCVISNNDAFNFLNALQGGGVYCSTSGTVERCTIVDNAADAGAGAYFSGGGLIQNSLLMANWTRSGINHGGGIFLDNGGEVKSCSILRNTSSAGGSGIYCDTSGQVINSIIYNNAYPNVVVTNDAGGFSMTYSCTTPTISGTGNINQDPEVVDLNTKDARLTAASPCIDKGINESWMFEETDLSDHPRVFNNHVDMGCHETLLTSTANQAPDNGSYESSWYAPLNATCQLQACSSLTSAWTNVQSVIVATNFIFTVSVTNSETTERFYRTIWLR